MKALYSIGIYVANFHIKLIALFNKKLKLGVVGRAQTFKKLKSSISETDKTLWFHCASLGEYEQGLPVFEKLKEQYPSHKIVLSFFSPSGYEIKKHTPIADAVIYLPLDTKPNAQKILDIVHPDFIIFVKYEIWPNLLHEIKNRNLRAILISAVFRKEQTFFKWYGHFLADALYAFEHIFVQDEHSKELLKTLHYNEVTVSGDTRFDRVLRQLETDNSIDFIETFTHGKKTIVFGSTWPEDDAFIIPFINNYPANDLKFIIAPHKISDTYTKDLKKKITKQTVTYSSMNHTDLVNAQVLILDTIGFLSKSYNYADIAYVGGAVGKTGLHNVLEPAVFGIPILIGAYFEKFPEAKVLVKKGGILSVKSQQETSNVLSRLINNEVEAHHIGQINAAYVQQQSGSVNQIIDYIRI